MDVRIGIGAAVAAAAISIEDNAGESSSNLPRNSTSRASSRRGQRVRRARSAAVVIGLLQPPTSRRGRVDLIRDPDERKDLLICATVLAIETSAHLEPLGDAVPQHGGGVIKHEQITTTTAKAKRFAPTSKKPRITGQAWRPSNCCLAQSRLMDEGQLANRSTRPAPRYAGRNGATRIIKAGIRIPMRARSAVTQFVDRDVAAKGRTAGR